MTERQIHDLLSATLGPEFVVPWADVQRIRAEIVASQIKAESDHNKRQATINRLKRQIGVAE